MSVVLTLAIWWMNLENIVKIKGNVTKKKSEGQ